MEVRIAATGRVLKGQEAGGEVFIPHMPSGGVCRHFLVRGLGQLLSRLRCRRWPTLFKDQCVLGTSRLLSTPTVSVKDQARFRARA